MKSYFGGEQGRGTASEGDIASRRPTRFAAPYSGEPIGAARYTIRYRAAGGAQRGALVVTDAQGAAYLFSGGYLQGRCGGDGACLRLVRLLERHGAWAPVPEVAPVTLEQLRRLSAEPDLRAG